MHQDRWLSADEDNLINTSLIACFVLFRVEGCPFWNKFLHLVTKATLLRTWSVRLMAPCDPRLFPPVKYRPHDISTHRGVSNHLRALLVCYWMSPYTRFPLVALKHPSPRRNQIQVVSTWALDISSFVIFQETSQSSCTNLSPSKFFPTWKIY